MACRSIYDSFISVCRRLVVALAARCAINCVVIAEDSVFKRRRWYANCLRILGNLLLRYRENPVEVLSREKWIVREIELSGASPLDGGVQLPKIAGLPLAQFLAGPESPKLKQEALRFAIRALFDFHQQTGQSHGDASATNVMIAKSGQQLSATWFDFDVAHRGSCSKRNRADDLRAILSTAQVREFDTLKESYPDAEIWEQAIRLVAAGSRDLFHLAQQLRCRRSTLDCGFQPQQLDQ